MRSINCIIDTSEKMYGQFSCGLWGICGEIYTEKQVFLDCRIFYYRIFSPFFDGLFSKCTFKNEIAHNVKKASKINGLRGFKMIICGEFVGSYPSS